MMMQRYFDFNTYLRQTFGCRVQKISIDAGLTCPNRDGSISTTGCIYCNSRGSGTGAHARGLSITDQIIHGKTVLNRRYKANKFIAYFQSFSNTYAPIEKLKAIYNEALSIEGIVGLSIGTRPDCVDDAILGLLENYTKTHLIWIEYGVQTIHDKTLQLIRRGHDYGCFERAVAATKGRGINLCAHIILGLPGETRSDMIQTAKKIGQIGLDGIKIHLLYVIKGTALETLYLNGTYTCFEQSDYAAMVCDILEVLPSTMVIQRLTGDPHPDELAAPIWALNKTKTLNMIKDLLEKRNSWQGKLLT